MASSHPQRDFEALESRRKEAARLFAKGELILAAIARQLHVSRQSVSRWYAEWKKGGAKALKGAGRAGRKPRLSSAQLRKVEFALKQGAVHHGHEGDLWTLPRVAAVIAKVTGVEYHPGHVWRILGSLQWTVQKPEKQAKERDEEKVRIWKQVRWPELKKTLHASKPGSSFKTRPDSLSSPRSAPPGRRAGKPRS